MEKCQSKDLLYNTVTKRCYKSCEKKNKDTHPVTKKCRQKCKTEKIRRAVDFRCVNKTMKVRVKKVKKTTKVRLSVPAPVPAPVEELIPPPLQKELTKNFHFIDELFKKGKDKTIRYDEGRHVSEIITIYFHEKYKQNCPMYPIKTYNQFERESDFLEETFEANKKEFPTVAALKQQLMKEKKSYYIDWNAEKFLKNLKLCLETGEQLIVIPLRIPNHLNMVIIKVPTREIIRFEPHGYTYHRDAENIKTNKFLENLTEEINDYLDLKGNLKFEYVEPRKTCPRRFAGIPDSFYDGWQVIEERNQEHTKAEGVGFCQLWSWFFAECVINNPELPIAEVYEEANKVLRKNEMGFATIIRGYFQSINDELVKMKKTFSIKKTYIEKIKNNDLLLMYLNKNRENLQTKPRKPFVGGKKKVMFILPTANPKVKHIK